MSAKVGVPTEKGTALMLKVDLIPRSWLVPERMCMAIWRPAATASGFGLIRKQRVDGSPPQASRAYRRP